MSLEMPPIKGKEPMERIDLRLPTTDSEDMRQLHEIAGVGKDMSDAYRIVIAEGRAAIKARLVSHVQYESALIEAENKQLVNQKLKQRQGDMQLAVDAIATELGEDNPHVKTLRKRLND